MVDAFDSFTTSLKQKKFRVTMSKNIKVKQAKQLSKTNTSIVNDKLSRKRNHVSDKRSKGVKKIKISTDCVITDVENVIGPNRTVWPEYRYYQIDQAWQESACLRMGMHFTHANEFQPGGPDVILTRPDLNSLINVQADGNCLFRAFAYVVTLNTC